MLNDTLANALSNIMNAEKIARSSCVIKPSSKIIENVLAIMNKHGYIGAFKVIDDKKGKIIRVELIGKINKTSVIKPRFPVKKDEFEKFEKRFLLAKDFGIIIVSTPKGLMTHQEAKSKGLGGKLISYCY